MIRAVIWARVSSDTQDKDDKVSLDVQETAIRALCEREGYVIVESLRFAHSANYIRFDKWQEAMRGAGIDAADRLEHLWRTQGFDVLVAFSDTRLGRTEGLFSVIVGETFASGAYLHLVNGGKVTQTEHHGFIALSGFKSSSDLTHMRALRETALDKRAAAGAPIGRYPRVAFTVAKGRTKADDRIVVREDRRLIWPILARVVMSKAQMNVNELDSLVHRALINEYGEINPVSGEAWPEPKQGAMYRLLHNPIAWGHSYRFWQTKTSKNGRAQKKINDSTYPRWAYDVNITPPAPTKIWRNTHEALWTGKLAAQLIAYLNYKHDIDGGKSTPASRYIFSGLLVCGGCGYRMIVARKHIARRDGTRLIYWRCPNARHPAGKARTPCTERRRVREDALIAQMTDILTSLLTSVNPHEYFNDAGDPGDPTAARLARLATEITRLDMRLHRLIDLQVDAPNEAALSAYTRQIADVSSKLSSKRAERAEIGQQLPTPESDAVQRNRVEQLAHIRAMGLSAFWRLSADEINQTLHGVLGVHVLVVDPTEGKIVRRTRRARRSEYSVD